MHGAFACSPVDSSSWVCAISQQATTEHVCCIMVSDSNGQQRCAVLLRKCLSDASDWMQFKLTCSADPCLLLPACCCRLGMSGLLMPQPEPQAPNLVAWHCNKQTIAVGHASSGAVLLYDCADTAGAEVLDKAQQVLTHQLQQQVINGALLSSSHPKHTLTS